MAPERGHSSRCHRERKSDNFDACLVSGGQCVFGLGREQMILRLVSGEIAAQTFCLLYTSPSPRDRG
eukprot:3939491-Rhodomonas_salina.4